MVSIRALHQLFPGLIFHPGNSHNVPGLGRPTALYPFCAFIIQRENVERPKVSHKDYEGLGKQAPFEKVKWDGIFFFNKPGEEWVERPVNGDF